MVRGRASLRQRAAFAGAHRDGRRDGHAGISGRRLAVSALAHGHPDRARRAASGRWGPRVSALPEFLPVTSTSSLSRQPQPSRHASRPGEPTRAMNGRLVQCAPSAGLSVIMTWASHWSIRRQGHARTDFIPIARARTRALNRCFPTTSGCAKYAGSSWRTAS